MAAVPTDRLTRIQRLNLILSSMSLLKYLISESTLYDIEIVMLLHLTNE